MLWEIASETEIIEASKFDRVMHKKVPEQLKSQIEPEDLEEGEPAELSELWDDFDTSYNELWTPIEYAEYEWAENIEIIKNPKKSTEDKYNKEKSYVINFYDEQEIPNNRETIYF